MSVLKHLTRMCGSITLADLFIFNGKTRKEVLGLWHASLSQFTEGMHVNVVEMQMMIHPGIVVLVLPSLSL